ncbi:MAG: type II secretion system minor pseudopilin GspJ [Candidatus Marinimicrobia bacterium]|nr:type II secretion system minor pseudopilin GspJ [Candidatus Neomarinimicrobiota bacterium]
MIKRENWSDHQQGFTLLELLIALSIFSLISLISFGGLKTVLNGQASGEKVVDQLAELEMAISIFERDLLQIVKRPVRDSYGDVRSAFIGNLEQSGMLEFTHTGRANPLKLNRSALQRVRYEYNDKEWTRKSWSLLDRAQNSKPQQQRLLSQLEHLTVRFLGGRQEWTVEWEMPLTPADRELTEIEKAQLNLPLAIELTLDIAEWGRMRRVFPLRIVNNSDEIEP